MVTLEKHIKNTTKGHENKKYIKIGLTYNPNTGELGVQGNESFPFLLPFVCIFSHLCADVNMTVNSGNAQ